MFSIFTIYEEFLKPFKLLRGSGDNNYNSSIITMKAGDYIEINEPKKAYFIILNAEGHLIFKEIESEQTLKYGEVLAVEVKTPYSIQAQSHTMFVELKEYNNHYHP